MKPLSNKPQIEEIEAVARAAYERCHPDDTFEDLKRRSRFNKEDRGLLRDWLAFAEARMRIPDEAGRNAKSLRCEILSA